MPGTVSTAAILASSSLAVSTDAGRRPAVLLAGPLGLLRLGAAVLLRLSHFSTDMRWRGCQGRPFRK